MKHDWEYKKLGEMFQTSSGGTPSKNHNEYYEGGYIPWLRSGEVSQGDIYESEMFITQKGLDNSSAKIFPCNTVVIAMYGATVGQVGILRNEMSTNQAICGIFPSVSYKPEFLKFVLSAQKSNYLKVAVGGAQPNISQQIIKDTLIPNIPLSTQQSIVSELDSLSKIIADCKETLKDYDALEQSIFYDMFGDPVKNDKGWEVKKLGDICDVKGGYAFKSENFKNIGIPVLRIGNINSGYFTQNNMVFWNEDDTLEKYAIYPGEMVMSLTGTVGKDDYGNLCILGSDYKKYYLNQRNAKLQLHNDLDKWMLFFLLKNKEIKGILTGVSRGVRQANIANRDIENLKIILPPLHYQQQFASKIEAIEQMKRETKKALQDAETLFQARMDYWFG